MGCCNKDDEKTPDDVDTCCGIRGKRCICLPYNDGFAQIPTIISLFFLWVWWPTLIICVVGMILFQSFLYLATVVAAIASFASLGVGIFAFVHLRNFQNCYPLAMYHENYNFDYAAFTELTDDDYLDYLRNMDDCREKTWGTPSGRKHTVDRQLPTT